jgi:hypothetical protein
MSAPPADPKLHVGALALEAVFLSPLQFAAATPCVRC